MARPTHNSRTGHLPKLTVFRLLHAVSLETPEDGGRPVSANALEKIFLIIWTF